MHSTYETVEDAYLTELRSTYLSAEFRNSPRGFPSRERLGAGFQVRHPVQRHVALPGRRSNLVFNFAEALWYLSGSAGLDLVAHYAPSIRRYSSDGVTLTGTAYGPRIFDYRGTGLDQWRNVIDVLADDPDSKRAVVQIFHPGELREPGNIDVACTLALQFMLREGRLHAVGYMRANDAYRGMVSDVFSFTFLLEMLARQLGAEVGSYVHQVGSLHVYDSDAPLVERVLREGADDTGPKPFPTMPAGDNWPHVRDVLRIEARLRANRLRLGPAALRALDLPRYWQDVIGLFELHRQLTFEAGTDRELLDELPPLYRRMMLCRWPRTTADQEVSA
ncbi:thymidylate synthase [Streptomyces sp. NPDC058471]|uniref:thymidylate synthase n=1 Tax=Streptomyces sp. NPDC058471 TaxID=3346516 RepID=UPI00365C575F